MSGLPAASVELLTPLEQASAPCWKVVMDPKSVVCQTAKAPDLASWVRKVLWAQRYRSAKSVIRTLCNLLQADTSLSVGPLLFARVQNRAEGAGQVKVFALQPSESCCFICISRLDLSLKSLVHLRRQEGFGPDFQSHTCSLPLSCPPFAKHLSSTSPIHLEPSGAVICSQAA